MYTDIKHKSTAALLSEVIVAGDTPRCVEFYYHMYGQDVVQLSVYMLDTEGNHLLLWQRTGNHGNVWRHGYARISLDLFQVKFVATGAAGIRNNIAIDDVKIANCDLFRKYR